MPDGSSSMPETSIRARTGSVVEAAPARTPPPGNLPSDITSFVGRGREIAEVTRLLSERRLVTLSGPGGAGKTRLALVVARDLTEGFEDGVWWVELAALPEENLVPQAVAQTLGMREAPGLSPTEALAEHLGSEKTLLVLDNCEHLIEACANLADALLVACPDLKILATSREPLRVAGETSFMVPSLATPDLGSMLSIEELAACEAVRLFVERAGEIDSGFALGKENAAAVARLCDKLGGIPLAIELAAARTRVLSIGQISEKLDDPLGLLTTGSRTAVARHRTLRATLQWSYDLLSEGERALFRRLSVFVGGFTLEAAETVGAGQGIEGYEILDLLSGLVDKSLVVAGPQAEAGVRYGMLEPVRQYALERLAEAGEEEEVRLRHAGHYLSLAEEAEPELLGADQGLWLGRLRTELGNLRGAISWSLEPGGGEGERAGLGLRLVASSWRFWDDEGFREGKRWLRAALERAPGGFPAVRAKALVGLGWILNFQGDYGPAVAALEEAVDLYGDLGDGSGAALALSNLGSAVMRGGFEERVPGFVEAGEALMGGDLEGYARADLRRLLACAATVEGDHDSAASQLEESLALSRELGDHWNTAFSLYILGMIELQRGDLERGEALIEECVPIDRGLEYRFLLAHVLLGLGLVAALRGRPDRAARLWGGAEPLRERLGLALSHFELVNFGYERDLAAVRSALSESTFDAAWAEGRAMSPEQAFEYALGESPHEENAHPLTRRELEVLRLVAQGLSNGQIAESLVLSEHTVHRHISNVLGKLGVSSRTAAVAEAARLDLF
jgi:predicted ATPase/DNA-binding CsgD family transcriptional regulator